jgi:succinate dehydrogenase / fumarate reductase membrane anchor subunit
MSRQASGLRAWALQRITAIYLGLYVIYLLIHAISGGVADYEGWRAWVTEPWVAIGLLLFVVALLIHAWVGIRDVLIDYVHPLGIRVLLLSLFAIGFIASGLWVVQAIFLARLHG